MTTSPVPNPPWYNFKARSDALAARAGAVTPDGQVVSEVGRIYMGPEFETAARGGVPISPDVAERGANLPSPDAAMWSLEKSKDYFNSMDPSHYELSRAYASSLSGSVVSSPRSVRSAYEDLLQQANYRSQRLGVPVSPWDIAREFIGRYGVPQPKPQGGGGGGGGGFSQNTQVVLSSASDAEALVDQALTQYLGRQADEQERTNFWKLLNKVERANPTVTTTTGAGGVSSTVQRGGVNRQQAAVEFALSQDDSAEYMANTQYMDWLMEKMTTDQTEVIASGL